MIKIAIIEDQEVVLDLIIKILSSDKEMQIVGSFTDGKSAVKKIPLLKPDIVLVDIGLPDISGIECIKALKPKCPTTNFMVWTVFQEENYVFEALRIGASSYILKTAKVDFIINSLKELYNGGSPMSPDIARVLVNKFFTSPNYNEKTISSITTREFEVLVLLSKGYLYKEIAATMNISVNTLKTHCYNIYQKLHVSNKIEAINLLYEQEEKQESNNE